MPLAPKTEPTGEVLRQVIDKRLSSTFLKTIHRVPLPMGGYLSLVRKRRHPVGDLHGAVVLIHGFGQNRYTWHTPYRSFANYLAFRGYDVFNLELRGFGRSAGAPLPDHPDVHFEVDLPVAINAVCELSGQTRVFLIGHSLGGAVCYAAAPLVYERVRGVVTLAGLYRFAPVPGWLSWGSRLLSRGLGHTPSRRALPTKSVGRAVEAVQRVMNSRWFRRIPFQTFFPGTIDRRVLSYLNQRAWEHSSLGVVLAISFWGQIGRVTNRRGDDKLLEFDALDVPLMVIAGSHDILLPPSGAKPAFINSNSTDKAFRVFGPDDGGHHWGHVDLILGDDAPSYVWPTVGDWLDER